MKAKTVRNIVIKVLEENLANRWTFESLGDKIEEALLERKVKNKGRQVKRPKSCYTFYCQRHRAPTVEEMSAKYGKENVMPNDIVRSLAAGWRELKEDCEKGSMDALMEMEECKKTGE